MKRIFLLFVLSGVFCTSSLYGINNVGTQFQDSATAKKFRKLLAKGNASLDNKKYDKTLDIANEILSFDSKNADAFNLIGRADYELKNYSRALEYFNKAIQYNNAQFLFYWNRAMCYGDLDRADDAIKDYNTAIRLCPPGQKTDLGKIYCNRAMCYRDKKKWDEAIRDADSCIFFNPKHLHVYWGRAFAYSQKKEYKKSADDYAMAIYYYRNDISTLPTLHTDRGREEKQLKEYDKAIADYDSALAYGPNYARAYWNRAIAHESKKEYEKAIVDYSSTIILYREDKESSAELYSSRAYSYMKLKKYNLATADANTSLELMPENHSGLVNLAYINLYSKDTANARKYFFKALAKDTSYGWNYYNIACYNLLTEKKEEAYAWLDQAFRHKYDNFEHISTDTDLDGIRNEDRFKTLLEKYKDKK